MIDWRLIFPFAAALFFGALAVILFHNEAKRVKDARRRRFLRSILKTPNL